MFNFPWIWVCMHYFHLGFLFYRHNLVLDYHEIHNESRKF